MRVRKLESIVVALVVGTIVALVGAGACDYPRIPPGADASALSTVPDAAVDARPIDAP